MKCEKIEGRGPIWSRKHLYNRVDCKIYYTKYLYWLIVITTVLSSFRCIIRMHDPHPPKKKQKRRGRSYRSRVLFSVNVLHGHLMLMLTKIIKEEILFPENGVHASLIYTWKSMTRIHRMVGQNSNLSSLWSRLGNLKASLISSTAIQWPKFPQIRLPCYTFGW